MKKIIHILLLSVFLSFSQKEDSTFHYRKVDNKAYTYGEELYYDVGYGFITAGEGYFKIMNRPKLHNGRKAFDIRFSVRSTGAISWVYKVNDRYDTWMDEEGIFPWYYEENIREGDYRRNNFAIFDQKKNLTYTKKDTTETPDFVHNIVSAFFYYRTLDIKNMKVGTSIVLDQFHEDSVYSLEVKVLAREVVEVPAGTFNTVLIEPLVVDGGLFQSEGSIKIWLTDDDRKIPIKVGTEIPIGFVGAELRSYKGVNGRIDAQIE